MKIACVLVTHFRAKSELGRHPALKHTPALVVDRPPGGPVVVDRFPAATGVTPGMTLEEALSRQGEAVVLETDEPHYRRMFGRMLVSLQGVGDRVEGEGLGTAYIGLDGLEELYGGEARLVSALLNCVGRELNPRAGVAYGKFPVRVAALASGPSGAVKAPQDVAAFLAPRPVGLLPVSGAVRAELRAAGLRTLGDVASMKEGEMTVRFGPAGRRAWRLAGGVDDSPLAPLRYEEPVVEQTSFPFLSASAELLPTAVDTLLKRAYARPRMSGRYAGGVALACLLHRAPAWERAFHFREAIGDWERASRTIRTRLDTDRPPAPVEELTLSLSRITGESGRQLSLLEGGSNGWTRRSAGFRSEWAAGPPSTGWWRSLPGTRSLR